MLALRDIMTRDVVAVSPDTSIAEIVNLLSSEAITGVPVMDHNKVLGVVSASDIVEFAGGRDSTMEPAQPVWDDIDEVEREIAADLSPHDIEEAAIAEQLEDRGGDDVEWFEEFTAADLMTRKLCSLPSNTPVQLAAREMVRTGVHRLLVIDDNELIGIATSMDFLRAVAVGSLR